MPLAPGERPRQGRAGETELRRRQARGLLLMALVVLGVSILRTGIDRVFTVGWWRLW